MRFLQYLYFLFMYNASSALDRIITFSFCSCMVNLEFLNVLAILSKTLYIKNLLNGTEKY